MRLAAMLAGRKNNEPLKKFRPKSVGRNKSRHFYLTSTSATNRLRYRADNHKSPAQQQAGLVVRHFIFTL